MKKLTSIETCHNCSQKMKFTLDLGLSGNHVLECPNCGHEHCRVVKKGKVMSDRWDSRNDGFFQVIVYAVDYDAATCTSSTGFTANLWVGGMA